MQKHNSQNASLEDKIEQLEKSISKLLAHCENLLDEKNTLSHANNLLLVERSELQTKNDKVRAQVEAMVDRLKAMEKTS